MSDGIPNISVDSKVEHICHDAKDFHSWVPEISLKIHEHFRVRKITVEVDGNVPGQIVQMVYEKP